MKGSKLKNVEGMLSKSDPFFEISRKIDASGGQTWDNIYRSGESDEQFCAYRWRLYETRNDVFRHDLTGKI
jgi:hypothetical protein